MCFWRNDAMCCALWRNLPIRNIWRLKELTAPLMFLFLWLGNSAWDLFLTHNTWQLNTFLPRTFFHNSHPEKFAWKTDILRNRCRVKTELNSKLNYVYWPCFPSLLKVQELYSLQEMATYVFGRARPILKYQFKSQGFFVTEFWLTPNDKGTF